HYLHHGKLPLEYTLIKIPKQDFTPEDIYSIINYMSLTFSYATKDDALTAYIGKKLGSEYLKDLKLTDDPELSKTLDISAGKQPALSMLSKLAGTLQKLGIPLWWGSNSWVIGPQKTKSGKVIFANDTHIDYGQPATWFEAHIKYPGVDFYGHHLPLIPFGVLGHNRSIAWGLTIFPYDNVNYYKEILHPEDPSKVMFKNEWIDLTRRDEIIKVKDNPDIKYSVLTTSHGPIMNDVDPNIAFLSEEPVSLFWTVLEFESKTLQAMYAMNRAENIDAFSTALPMLDVVGLYVNYGDKDGNYAWWATGKLPVFREGLNRAVLLDGSTGKDEVIRYLDFKEHPKNINAREGYVATANNDPVLSGSHFVPGNYVQSHRIDRINEVLSQEGQWDINKVKALQLDVMSPKYEQMAKMMLELITKNELKDEYYHEVYDSLFAWKGSYETDQSGPVILDKLIYHITDISMQDELGPEMMKLVDHSYMLRRSLEYLYYNDKAVWWDDINTPSKETRMDVFKKAFLKTADELKEQLGSNVSAWKWGDVHKVSFKHAVGEKWPMNKFFNVGSYPIPGGNNTLSKMEFRFSGEKIHEVLSGPTVRILIDFDEVGKGLNINPTGQSGNFVSKYYRDQTKMFVDGKYRGMLMDNEDIRRNLTHTLMLIPAKN
ncbi:MAG TPA: penicillin acylase family protein, partial [Saprospiraceae bacterium]|nr:penicillin acylase family protein [Saprospiraceae bacterium]